jgi:large subunit ribosomal protein L25
MELQAFERTQKLAALRGEGYLPAVIYDKKTNRNVYVERKAFDKAFRKVSTHGVITLKFDGGESLDILVKDVSMNKRKRIVQHADFLIVSDEPLDVAVPVHTHGNAKGVKESGGVLDIVMHNVVVNVTPKNIPQELVVDIKLPEGVKLVTDPNATILVIHHARVEEAAPVAETPAEPEVIKKGKTEEE